MSSIRFETVGELREALSVIKDDVPIGIRGKDSEVVNSIRLDCSLENLYDRFYIVLSVDKYAKEVGRV